MAFHRWTNGQSERTIQILEDMLCAYVIDFEASRDWLLLLAECTYNNIYQSSIQMDPYEAVVLRLYSLSLGRLGSWALILFRSFGEGVMKFRKKGKLSPQYIGLFEILEKVGEVAYRLALPPSLSGVHMVFYVSMLRKYYGDSSHVLDFSLVQLDKDLTYVEEPMALLDRHVLKLRSKNIALMKWSLGPLYVREPHTGSRSPAAQLLGLGPGLGWAEYQEHPVADWREPPVGPSTR
ncbi:uncharacterized protein [Nicotiana sylvestris]|uniref:uncharacterized protein n=1 Tax=Nicotiana sylvestris TaxID=4096 RepID=UPI00388C36BE